MPSVLLVPAATGASFAPFPGGPALVTDIDVTVVAVGPDVHLFPTGPTFRVQHVGWIALAYTVPLPPFPPIGGSTHDIGWWQYIDFVWEDKVVSLSLPYATDSLVWNLAVGAIVAINVSA